MKSAGWRCLPVRRESADDSQDHVNSARQFVRACAERACVTIGWSLNGRTCGQSCHAARQPYGAPSLRGGASTNLATRT
jgi:hypothetical protein